MSSWGGSSISMVGNPSSKGIIDCFSLGMTRSVVKGEGVCRHICVECNGGQKEVAGAQQSSAVAADIATLAVDDFMLQLYAQTQNVILLLSRL